MHIFAFYYNLNFNLRHQIKLLLIKVKDLLMVTDVLMVMVTDGSNSC